MTIKFVTVRIRRDDWIQSKPWHADLVFDDDGGSHKLKSWLQFFSTKKALIKEALAVEPDAVIIDQNGKRISQ